MSDCIAGRSSEAPMPPMTAQKMMIEGQALGHGHRDGADCVAEEPEDVGELAADEVAGLAADQDEGRRHQRLERDRALYAAHRGVEVLDHRGDRDVHQRRVDHQHEHRHRQQQREASVERHRLRRVGLHGAPKHRGAARQTMRSG
jgi:hypothetical protein